LPGSILPGKETTRTSPRELRELVGFLPGLPMVARATGRFGFDTYHGSPLLAASPKRG
jgi:hypothetical protein